MQFCAVLWLLMQGRALAQYESMRELLELLGVLDFPRKYWNVMVGWEMADHLAIVLADHTKQVISKARFFSLSSDEVTTIDSQLWLSIHIYVCIDYKRVPILMSLSHLEQGNLSEAIRETILGMLVHHSGMSALAIASGLVCFGADGVFVFQGSRSGVTTQLKDHVAPFMFGMHCMAHKTNLAVEPLSDLPIVGKIEDLCQAMYGYFSHSPKRHLEFQRLPDVLEIEGRKILRNVKTRWISLLDPLKRVMGEYKTLIVKMGEDAAVKLPSLIAKQAAARESARLNYDLLCDVGTLLGLSCFMPLLDCVNLLMKFAQSDNVFVSDYVVVVKICQAELFLMYCDDDTAWQKQHFEMLHDIIDDHSFCISQEWVTDLNIGVETLSFRIGGHTYAAHSICAVTGKKLQVTKEQFVVVTNSVKAQCRDAAEMLSRELDFRFPEVELMNSLAVVFPQYWLQPNCDDLFPLHVKTLRAHFAVVRKVNFGTKKQPDFQQVDPLVDGRLLGLQMSLFKLTMKSHAEAAMGEPRDQNPLTKLWLRVGQNALMLNRLSEFFKVAEIAICAVLGSVEDERTFSTLSFMKSKLRNRLTGHVDTCVKLFSQDFFTLTTFPVNKAIVSWREERCRRGVEM